MSKNSAQTFEQNGRTNAESVSEFHNIEQRDIPLASLHSTDVVAMQVCQLSKSFLR
jgi:hypothetical protein